MEFKKLKILFEENRILHYSPTHTHAILWRTVQAQELKSLYFDSHGGYFKHGRGGHFIMFIRLGSLWNMCGPNAKSNFTVRRWLRYFDGGRQNKFYTPSTVCISHQLIFIFSSSWRFFSCWQSAQEPRQDYIRCYPNGYNRRRRRSLRRVFKYSWPVMINA